MADRTSPLIAIVGPTASGKSELAMFLAKKYDGEIIAADARTIYRGMDIGTAKPNAKDRQMIKHHLLDIVYPDEHYSAAHFKQDAIKAIESIDKKNKIPFLVGGTGLYIDSVLFDYTFLPKTNVKTRKKIQQMTPNEIFSTLDKLNIKYDHVDKKNRRYLERLLETKGAEPGRKPLRPNTLVLGVSLDRKELRQRIQRRTEAMMRKGLRREVEALKNKYGWDAPGMNAIGYKEWRDYYEGEQSRAGVGRDIVQSSLNFAKRQRTWFKRNKDIKWVLSKEEASNLVDQFIAGL